MCRREAYDFCSVRQLSSHIVKFNEAATVGRMQQPYHIGKSGRRIFNEEFKRKVVEEYERHNDSGNVIAARNKISHSMIHTWCKQFSVAPEKTVKEPQAEPLIPKPKNGRVVTRIVKISLTVEPSKVGDLIIDLSGRVEKMDFEVVELMDRRSVRAPPKKKAPKLLTGPREIPGEPIPATPSKTSYERIKWALIKNGPMQTGDLATLLDCKKPALWWRLNNLKEAGKITLNADKKWSLT